MSGKLYFHKPEQILRPERQGQRDERWVEGRGGQRRPQFRSPQRRGGDGVRQHSESVPVRLQQEFPQRLDQLPTRRRQLHFQSTRFLETEINCYCSRNRRIMEVFRSCIFIPIGRFLGLSIGRDSGF